MARQPKIKLTCEGASKEFDLNHAERILNFQEKSRGLNPIKLYSIPEDSKYILKDGKLIKSTSGGSNKSPKE